MRSSTRHATATTYVLLLLFAIMIAGCNRPTEVAKTAPPVDESKRPALRILLVDSPELAGPLEIRWQSTSQQKLDIKNISTDELLSKSTLESDLIIYPAMLIGELIQRDSILAVPQKIAETAKNGSGTEDIVKWPVHWLRSGSYGKKLYGIVLATPLPLIIRNRSDDTSPFTIESLINAPAANSQTSTSPNQNAPADNSWLVDRFLVFLADEKKDSNQLGWFFQLADMSPRLLDAEFERAATKFVLASKTQKTFWQQPMPDAWEAVRRGELSWTLGYPRANLENTETTSTVSDLVVGFYGKTRPPNGSSNQNETASLITTFDNGRGLMASLASTNRQSAASSYFLEWLNNENQRVAFNGATERVASLRENAIATQGPEESLQRQTITTLAESIPNELRFAGVKRFRNRLQKMLEAILANPENLNDELAKCNQDFDKITEELGRATQRSSIEKSLLLTD